MLPAVCHLTLQHTTRLKCCEVLGQGARHKQLLLTAGCGLPCNRRLLLKDMLPYFYADAAGVDECVVEVLEG